MKAVLELATVAGALFVVVVIAAAYVLPYLATVQAGLQGVLR